MEKTPKVLFFSRGSASRAQIAQGFLRSLAGDRYAPFSAGADGPGVSPLAAEVMHEIGIDISTQKPSEIASLFRETFHYVVVMGDESHERYPLYPFARKLIKWPMPNPESAAEPEKRKDGFRQVRDAMKSRVEELIQTMNQADRAHENARSRAA